MNAPAEYHDPGSYRSIWRLGWPVMVNMGAHTLFSLIDLYWIGSLGTNAIAAVALCGNVLFSMFGLTIIIEGILMIQEGGNPRLIEQKLNAHLEPEARIAHFDRMLKREKSQTAEG